MLNWFGIRHGIRAVFPAAPNCSWGLNNSMESINTTIIEAQVIEALRTCFDPEIPVNIYEMGLIYGVKVDEAGAVSIEMTLTSPHCPAAQSIPSEVEGKVRQIPGVTDVTI